MGIDSCITKFLIPAHTLAVIKANGFLQLFLPIFFLLYYLLLALFIETVISRILMRRKPSVIALDPDLHTQHTACNGHYASIGGVSTEQCCHFGSSSPLSSPPLASPGCCRAGSPDIRVTYLHFTSLDWCEPCVQVRRGRSLWRRWRY